MVKILSTKQLVQEAQYSFPYHYIPSIDNGYFSQTLFWPWGMRYMAGIQLVISVLKKMDFSSLLDVGCGDGRFLNLIHSAFPKTKFLGVDYSENAISLAKAFNPCINFVCMDITSNDCREKFDVITMIEVLEHIQVEYVHGFLQKISKWLLPGGTIILTVPHVNKAVQSKHYQHFSSSNLREVLKPFYSIERIMPFDKISRFNSFLLRFIGHIGKNYIITNKEINSLIYRRILHGCLTEQPENKCGRLLAIAKVRK